MIWVLATGLGLVAGLATGGRLDNLARLRFRWPAAALAAVVVREAVLFTPLNRVDGAQWLYAAALAVIVLWTVWHFDRVRGVWLVTPGGAMNLLVILSNGGRMPVAAALAGTLVQQGQIGQYTLMGSHSHLGFLADWISVPATGGAYSPGDLVIAAGLALVAFLGVRRTMEPVPDSPIVIDPP